MLSEVLMKSNSENLRQYNIATAKSISHASLPSQQEPSYLPRNLWGLSGSDFDIKKFTFLEFNGVMQVAGCFPVYNNNNVTI